MVLACREVSHPHRAENGSFGCLDFVVDGDDSYEVFRNGELAESFHFVQVRLCDCRVESSAHRERRVGGGSEFEFRVRFLEFDGVPAGCGKRESGAVGRILGEKGFDLGYERPVEVAEVEFHFMVGLVEKVFCVRPSPFFRFFLGLVAVAHVPKRIVYHKVRPKLIANGNTVLKVIVIVVFISNIRMPI